MVKIPPLPATDIPRFATMASLERRLALEKHGLYFPDTTLEPFRGALFDICNVQPGFAEIPPTSWERVQQKILRRCRENSVKNCLAVAEALWSFCDENEVKSIERHVREVPVGFGFSLRFWHGFYLVHEGQAVFPFFEPRLSKGLSERTTSFVHSFMSEFLLTGDFADAKVAVVRFPKDGNKRRVEFHYLDGPQAYSRNDMTTMLQLTYADWISVYKARPPKKKTQDSDQINFSGPGWE